MVRGTRAMGAGWLLCALLCAAFSCKGEANQPQPTQPRVDKTPAPLRLVFVTELEGVLEPCGCTSRPSGGVDHLSAALQSLKRDAPDALVLSAGDQLSTGSASTDAARTLQDAWKVDTLAAVLSGFGFAAIAAGQRDCERAPERVATLAHESKAVLVSARACGATVEVPAPSAVLHAHGMDLGLLAIDAASAAEAAAQVQALRARGAGLTIVFQSGGDTSTRAIVDEAGADFVVHTGGDSAPHVSVAHGGAIVLSAGRHAEELIALDVWPGSGSGAWRILEAPPAQGHERGVVVRQLAIDRDSPKDAKVRVLLDQLFARINTHNAEAARNVEPVAPPAGAPAYVGARTCAACHTPAYFWWQHTPHARAFETLVGRGRQLDLECIGCHVTGYEQPGGSTIGHLDELKGVGCESCHGPGSAHVNNPQQPGRAIRRDVPEATCVACHDRAHSDLFQYLQARTRLLAPAHGQAERAR